MPEKGNCFLEPQTRQFRSLFAPLEPGCAHRCCEDAASSVCVSHPGTHGVPAPGTRQGRLGSGSGPAPSGGSRSVSSGLRSLGGPVGFRRTLRAPGRLLYAPRPLWLPLRGLLSARL